MGCAGSSPTAPDDDEATYAAANLAPMPIKDASVPIEDASRPIEEAGAQISGAALRDRMQRERDEKLNAGLRKKSPSPGAKELCSGVNQFECKGLWSEKDGTAAGLFSAKAGQYSLTVSAAAKLDIECKVSWAVASDDHSVMVAVYKTLPDMPQTRLKLLSTRDRVDCMQAGLEPTLLCSSLTNACARVPLLPSRA
jgi:hypothetical protein